MKPKNKNIKNSNFRTWKSGKGWLYASTVIATLAGGVAVKSEVKADSVQDPQATVNSLVADTTTTSMAADVQSQMSTAAPVSAAEVSSAETVAPASLAVPYSEVDSASAVSVASSVSTTETQTAPVSSTGTVADSMVESTASPSLSDTANDAVPNQGVEAQVSSNAQSSLTTESQTAASVTAVVSSGSTLSDASSFHQVDLVLASLTSAATSTAVLDGVSLSVTDANASLINLNVSSLASSMGSYYDLTVGDAVNQLISEVGVQGVVSGLQEFLTTVSPYLSSIPAASSVIDPINSVVSGINTALSLAAALGLPTSAVNSIIGNILVAGINAAGNALNTSISSTVASIPLVGTALNDFLSPILTNLSGTSVSSLVTDAASSTGLTTFLNTVTSLVDNASPTVDAALQDTIDGINSLYSFISPVITGAENVLSSIEGTLSDISGAANNVLAPITSVLTGGLSTIEGVLGDVVNSIEGALGLNTTASANTVTSSASDASSSSSAASSASSTASSSSPASNASSASSASSGDAVTAVASLVVISVSIAAGSSINALSLVQTATDSQGNPVPASDIQVVGTVPTKIPGQYVLLYSFTDTANADQTVTATATITVTSQTTEEMQSTALAAQALASSAVASDNAQIASLTADLNNLSGTVSDPTTDFTSTSNYPSSAVVVLPNPGSFTANVNQINSYFLQYVNELREANGQSDLSYSASEQAFAQERAQEIVSNFSHTGADGSTEDIAASGQVVSTFLSNQEIAYYMVMDWYDESDNPEAVGDGHYGHRANLLYGGPSMGIGFVSLSTPNSSGFDSFYTFEAPQYTSETLYNEAVAISNSETDPSTVPLPKLTFKYVDPTQYAAIESQIVQANSQLQADELALTSDNTNLQFA